MIRSLLGRATSDDNFNNYLDKGGGAFVSPSLRPYLLAALLDQGSQDRPAVVLTGDDRTAKELAGELAAWLAPRRVRFYPSRGVAYESHLAPPAHLVGLRVAAIDALLESDEDAPVVVASAIAMSEKIPDPELRPKAFRLKKGELLDLDECAEQLVAAGYERVDQVDDRGQFALRGGLLDVFPASEDRAVRVDLFDIEIESIRYFSTFTQRSLEEVDEIEIDPCAELALEHRGSVELGDEEVRPDVSELLPIDRFIEPLSLAPESTTVVIAADEELAPALSDNWQDVTAAFHDAEAHSLYVSPEQLRNELDERAQFSLTSVEQDRPFLFPAQAVEVAASSIQAAEAELEKQVRSNYATLVAWPTRGEGERAGYNLGRLSARWIDQDDETDEARLLFAQSPLANGFVAPQFELAVYPYRRLVRRKREATGPRRGRGVLRSFADLAVGDYVVHEDHGVARFAGFETRTVVDVTRDYLYLEYQGEDKVFVPSDQLAKISRYVGAGGEAPKLSKLGGTRWEQMKARARRAAQELAGELLNLYAERRRREGYPFEADGEWQRDFEEAFPYRETPDQLDAIEQVKADMESGSPMDRLICGDVGFGKTEVALRAAFKAAASGKQVLVLVPTTILAQQHYGTFVERLRDYPFTVGIVSRFRSRAEQKAALDAFAAGSLDILVGTHRVLSADVNPKDLGLVIVDEEQRFGVKQKEFLRQLKLKVDVISMSATPIPRTLQMSLAGVRDISVIETPPEGRRPVRTYVGEYDEQLVKTAIERELDRKGQVFFMHNRVESIDETALRIRALCPEARVIVVHGQLEEDELEQRMLLFLRGDADVLVCTSIIESGLDIPQANTLIVERADTFGLSQLYQIRGRVGRGNQRAYAYLLYPSASALTVEAANRLAALSDYTELGAGFKIAMRDLELRGAGNLLGDEQSGHVAALGFELYMQMLDEAVGELESAQESDLEIEPVRLDLPIDAYVPAEYIPFEKAKIDVHRRIAAAHDLADLGELREELADRFGPVPVELEDLIKLQEVRIKLGRAGARNVAFKGGRLAVSPIELDSKGVKALRAKLPEALYESGKSQFSLRVSDDASDRFVAVSTAADLLIEVLSTGDKDQD